MSQIESDFGIGEVIEATPEVAPSVSPLSRVTSGRVKKPRRIMIYGVQGVGKSTFATRAPNAIVVATEEGVNDIEVAKFPVAKTLTEFRQNLVSLRDERHSFKAVVIDSVDWLEKLVFADVAREAGLPSIGDIDYGRGYPKAADKFGAMLGVLDTLRDQGMTVILVAHCRQEKVKPAECEPYDKYMPDLHRTISSQLQEWCDEVLFAAYQIGTIKKEGEFGREHVRAVGGLRILRTQEQPYCSAKCRLPNVPTELPLSWPEFSKYLA